MYHQRGKADTALNKSTNPANTTPKYPQANHDGTSICTGTNCSLSKYALPRRGICEL